MDHIAIMKKSLKLTDKILSGQKTVESRWYKQKRAPWYKVSKGDNLYFKNSGEPVTIQAKVKKVIQFSNLDPSKIREILYNYSKVLGLEDSSFLYDLVRDKKYCILVYLDQVHEVKPFFINKSGFGNMSAWISTDDVNKIVIT